MNVEDIVVGRHLWRVVDKGTPRLVMRRIAEISPRGSFRLDGPFAEERVIWRAPIAYRWICTSAFDAWRQYRDDREVLERRYDLLAQAERARIDRANRELAVDATGTDLLLYRLLVSAVRHHAAVETIGTVFSGDAEFMRADEDFIEAAAAYAKGLDEVTRRRLCEVDPRTLIGDRTAP